MKPSPKTILCLGLLGWLLGAVAPNSIAGEVPKTDAFVAWEQLPSLPDPIGMAGSYVGVSGSGSKDALIVAGGANFPDGSNWDGHPKVWHDRVFLLSDPDAEWQVVAQLARPLAYGVSVSRNGSLICIGGGDKTRHYADVFSLTWTDGKMEVDPLPPLPQPCAFMAGVLAKDTIYVAGGMATPGATQALKTFWALDLSEPTAHQKWRELTPWPGKARMLPVMAALNNEVFLFSGARLLADKDGNATREFLQDAYCFKPQTGTWKAIADVPRPIAAAPTPAARIGQTHLLVLSGDDGRDFFRAAELRDRHPGFPPELFAYHPITDRWTQSGLFPKRVKKDLGPNRNAGTWPPVTTSTTVWRGRYVVATGEARPGVRTPEVWWARPVAKENSFGVINWLVLGTYMAVLVGMGVYLSRREHSTVDYFLAGRRVPWWAAGLSIFATMLSAITYLSVPAIAYAENWVRAVLNLGVLAVAPIIVVFYLPFFRRLKVTSAYEYLERRFSLGIRLFGSASFVLYQLGRMGVVLLLPALALSAVTGVDVIMCVLIMGVLSTLYTVLGGIEAVIWTDVVQVVVLIGGAVSALVIIALNLEGGFGEIISVGLSSDKFRLANVEWNLSTDSIGVIVLGALFVNLLPYTSDQAVVQRYLTTPTERQAARAIWANALLTIPAVVLFFFVGTAVFAFYKAHPADLEPLQKVDQIFAWFITSEMPVGLAGLVIAGVFAAAMSSLDSSMHSISTVLTTDVVRRLGQQRTERQYLSIARWLTIVCGLLGTMSAILMTQLEIQYLWNVFLEIVGLSLGTLGGLFLLGIFTRRTMALHAWIGLSASIFVLVMIQMGPFLQRVGIIETAPRVNSLLYGGIAAITCFTVGWAASQIYPRSSQRMLGLTAFSRIQENYVSEAK